MRIKIILLILFFLVNQIYSKNESVISESEIFLLKKYLTPEDVTRFIQLYNDLIKNIVIHENISFNKTLKKKINKFYNLYSTYKNEIEYFNNKIDDMLINCEKKNQSEYKKILSQLDNANNFKEQKYEFIKKVQLINKNEYDELWTLKEIIEKYTEKIFYKELYIFEMLNKMNELTNNDELQLFNNPKNFINILKKETKFILDITFASIFIYLFLGFIFFVILIIIFENKKRKIKVKQIISSYSLKSILIILFLNFYRLIIKMLENFKIIENGSIYLFELIVLFLLLIILNFLVIYSSFKKLKE
ncbi:MAG TPA: hypothetical protein PLD27_12665 [bacterium]|nr:hypothetical protein [bacterium]